MRIQGETKVIATAVIHASDEEASLNEEDNIEEIDADAFEKILSNEDNATENN